MIIMFIVTCCTVQNVSSSSSVIKRVRILEVRHCDIISVVTSKSLQFVPNHPLDIFTFSYFIIVISGRPIIYQPTTHHHTSFAECTLENTLFNGLQIMSFYLVLNCIKVCTQTQTSNRGFIHLNLEIIGNKPVLNKKERYHFPDDGEKE